MGRLISLDELTGMADFETMKVLLTPGSVPNLETQRTQKLGKVIYAHFGRNSGAMWLPTELIISGSTVDNVAIQANLDRVLFNLAGMQIASPGNQYGLNGIGGDVVINTALKRDGIEQEVVILPQAELRGKGNSNTMKILNIDHPLTEDYEGMIQAMVVLGARSGFPAPYVRMEFVADQRNGMAIADARLQGTVIGTTFSFTDPNVPNYQSAASPKTLVAKPTSIHGHHTELGKIAGRYLPRLDDFLKHIGTTEDTAYYLPNGMLADARCFNILYFTYPDKHGTIKAIFVEPSEGNYFFSGKTDATLRMILGDERTKVGNIEVAIVKSPRDFAYHAGLEGTTEFEHLTGRDLTNYVIQTKIAYMVLLGTYKSLIGVNGITVLDKRNNPAEIFFQPSDAVRAAVNSANDVLIRTCYAVNGGTPLTSDPHMSGIYDAEAARKGKLVRIPMTPETRLEDTVERYVHGQFKFVA
ncbi:hypothetical protein HYY69_03470 [Candidatus Woesearchaeota archaeon]|nr:hypothetical protein [Candidatus Woesearchaeota archaeon]